MCSPGIIELRNSHFCVLKFIAAFNGEIRAGGQTCNRTATAHRTTRTYLLRRCASDMTNISLASYPVHDTPPLIHQLLKSGIHTPNSAPTPQRRLAPSLLAHWRTAYTHFS